MNYVSFIELTDGYKCDHRRQYPENTTNVYSNFTPRGSRIEGVKGVVFFGFQYFLIRYLGEIANETFFQRPKQEILDEYKELMDSYLGPNDIGTDHIAALHDLGYLPLLIRAVPEGTVVPIRVPVFTVENTHPDFFWVVNYFETLYSNMMWHVMTSATIAHQYRKIIDKYSALTGAAAWFSDWQCHDFSFRGMSVETGIISSAGHLTSFTGTDTLPALRMLKKYYGATGLVGGSVPATEHSVMTASGKDNEMETFERLLNLYPKGIVSVVSDTWNLWDVLTVILPKLHDKVMAREGKLVIRPDSGDPVKIICGDPESTDPRVRKGVIQLLWDEFGGTTNEKGFKTLDPHIGAIYGDSITLSRAENILRNLMTQGFASDNIVFGVGSYTYQGGGL
jgi:nicotinamide phosphoribosyltransferase